MNPSTIRNKFPSSVMTLIQEHLSDLGMTKCHAGIFTMTLRENTLAWVGLNKATDRNKGSLEVNPVIGIRHQTLEKVLADIINKPFHKCIPPTISIHLGYLMPQKKYTPWLFEEHSNYTLLVTELKSSIKNYGISFVEANAALDAIIKKMETVGYGIPEQLLYRLPVAYYLMGDGHKAVTFLNTQLNELKGRDDLFAMGYKDFTASFLKRLSQV